MRKLLLRTVMASMAFMLISTLVWAQPGFTYQAVAVDESRTETFGQDSRGEILVNQPLGVRFSIREGSEEGEIRYTERHETTTDIFGIFRLVVGRGTSQTGTPLVDLAWGQQKYFLQVEIDLGGGLIPMGAEELVGSPYALNSKTQTLALDGNELSISSGNSVTLNDNDETNELQNITRNGTQIILSHNGGAVSVADNDNDSNNEIQDLFIEGGRLSITGKINPTVVNLAPYLGNNLTEEDVDAFVSNNGYVTEEADGSVENEIQDLQLMDDTLKITNNPEATEIDLHKYRNVFETSDHVTSNENGDYNGDDFVFGSPTLHNDADPAHKSRFFFDKSKGAFRAGFTETFEWDDAMVGNASAAFGYGTMAQGGAATAFGLNTIAEGSFAFAGGLGSYASGQAATAFGNTSSAQGLESFAAGYLADALGTRSIALGSNVAASGDYSFAAGSANTASGYAAVSIGQSSVASGSRAIALGEHLFSRSRGEIAIGVNGTDYTPLSKHSTFGPDRLFSIGNGLSASMTDRSDAFVVLKSGDTRVNGELTIDADNISGAGDPYTLPAQDGTANQVMTTDGNGNLNWNTPSVLSETDVDNYVSNNGYLTSEVDGSVTNEIQNLALVGNTLSITNNAAATNINLAPYLDAAFRTTASVTSNAPGNYATDDFVFGSPQLADDGDPAHDARMFFDKSKGAFRAGFEGSTDWDDNNVGAGSIAFSGGRASGGSSFAMGSSIASGHNSLAIGSSNTASGAQSIALGIASSATSNDAFAFGNGSQASNNFAIAMGWSATASGYASISLGSQSTSGGTYAVAIGQGNNAGGAYALSIGRSTIASGYAATATGDDTQANGMAAVSSGSGTTASGSYSLAGGLNSVASNSASVAFGQSSIASGARAFAVGMGTQGIGNNSQAMGIETRAHSFAETTIGTYSTIYAPVSTIAFNSADRLFAIGNGLDNANRSNALVMEKSGDTWLYGELTLDADNVNGPGESYTLPAQDGNANQVMTTDGNGNVSWANGAATLTEAEVDDFVNDNGYLTAEGDGSVTNEIQDLTINTATHVLNITNHSAPTNINLGPYVNVFETTAQVTSNENGNYATDDFVFGSSQLAGTGNASLDTRMFFDKSKYAFRAGYAATLWDDAHVGIGSAAFGINTRAGNWAFAAGSNNTASTQSFAGGFQSNASGNTSVALGNSATASGSSAMAVNSATLASGLGSFATGMSTAASGQASSTFGYGSLAFGTASSAFGSSTRARSAYEFVIGTDNTDYTPASSTDWILEDRLFVIGNTNLSIMPPPARSDALVMLKNGNTRLHGQLTIDADNVNGVGGDYTFPGQRGTNGQVIMTNGSGVLSWSTLPVPTITTTAGVSSNANGNYATDHFVFGGPTLDFNEVAANYNRFFFNKAKAAFRAGGANTSWNDINVGSYSTAFGNGATASGDESFALGTVNTLASGAGSVAMGGNARATSSSSFALGLNTLASGMASFAMGSGAQATNQDATAMGTSITASGLRALAIGTNSISSGFESISIGVSNTSSNVWSTTIGFHATATGERAVALGNYSSAGGYGALALGSNASASGLYSFAVNGTASAESATAIRGVASAQYSASFGFGSAASGIASGAFGVGATASGYGAFSLGLGNFARSAGEVATGYYSTDYAPASTDTFVGSDRLFVIGNGADGITRSDALVMLKNGNTRLHGQLTIDADNVNGVGEQYTLPAQDGNANQVMTTDGNGNVSWQNALAAEVDGSVTNEIQNLLLANDILTITSDPDVNTIDLSPYRNVFETTNNITSNENGEYATDDFVFGSPHLDTDGDPAHDTRMLFDKSTGAFRAGRAETDLWDEGNRGTFSAAFGENSIARGQYSFAAGLDNLAHAASTVAIGTNTLAEGYNSIALGRNAETTGTHSMSLSLYGAARSFGETTMGIFPTDYAADDNSKVNFVATDRLFVIGNGTGPASRSNALVIDKGGNATLLGTLTDASDIRLKRNITPLRASLASVRKLQGVNYQWNGLKPQDTLALQTGFIAQAVEKLFPELVKTDDEGFKSVNYIGLIPHLIESVKELDLKNNELVSENQSLKEQLQRMQQTTEEKFKQLEARMISLEGAASGPVSASNDNK